jgi:hypothetical protein
MWNLSWRCDDLRRRYHDFLQRWCDRGCEFGLRGVVRRLILRHQRWQRRWRRCWFWHGLISAAGQTLCRRNASLQAEINPQRAEAQQPKEGPRTSEWRNRQLWHWLWWRRRRHRVVKVRVQRVQTFAWCERARREARLVHARANGRITARWRSHVCVEGRRHGGFEHCRRWRLPNPCFEGTARWLRGRVRVRHGQRRQPRI